MVDSPQQQQKPAEDEEATHFLGGLYVKDAYKFFGVTKALNGCSFSANFGEIHAIVGGNGSGKSTLAKLLSGVLPADSGKVSVLNQYPSSPSIAREIGIATVFQEVLVADECSVVDNLFVGSDSLWSKSSTKQEKQERATTLMRELAGIDVDPESMAGTLPLGIKAWITIGRALLCEPKVLILDESSAALDLDSTERLFTKMRQLRDNGTAILIVTHRIAELIRISDRATILRDGKDVGVLQKEEITEKNLLQLMTGKSSESTSTSKVAHQTKSSEIVLQSSGLKVWESSEEVDFSLRKGEIIGLTGLDGHGQDDFVRILAGIQPAVHGVPRVKDDQGQFHQIGSLEQAKKYGISYVSGDRKREGILPNMSIFENLLIALYRTNKKVDALGIIDWLGLSGIFDWEVERLSIKTGPKDNLITSLSGGNQQKVLIGRSFALHPRILVLNDPARGIDVEAKGELYKHLREYAQEGNSVVYMSSELEEFIGFCSRVLVFRNASVFDEFVDQDIEPVGILESMFGQVRDNQFSATQQQSTAIAKIKDRGVPLSSATESNQDHRLNPTTIRIVDFDKQRHEESELAKQVLSANEQQQGSETPALSPKKMKVSYF